MMRETERASAQKNRENVQFRQERNKGKLRVVDMADTGKEPVIKEIKAQG